LESGVLRAVLEILNNVRGVEMDLQFAQPGTMDRYRKKASDSRDADVPGARMSEDKRL